MRNHLFSRSYWLVLFLGIFALPPCFLAATAQAEEAEMLFDFREGLHGWTGNPRVEDMASTDEGLHFKTTGEDPWIEGPPVANMPLGDRVRLTIRMKTIEGSGSGEIFYGPSFSGGDKTNFYMQHDGAWHEYTAMLPEQEAGNRLRIDPTSAEGEFVIAWIKAELVVPLIEADFSPPTPIEFSTEQEVQSGNLTFRHNGEEWGGYALLVDGEIMAMGHSDPEIGMLIDEEASMFPLSDAEIQTERDGDALLVTAQFTDSGGANWRLERRIVAQDAQSDAIDMQTTVHVDQDREIYHLPWVTLFPGLHGYGAVKNQAILPGVDYLENEPSSSMASFNAAQADRRIVEDYKLTLPMMAVQVKDRYVGLLWDRDAEPAAIFDSPDRVFNAEAHLMALWYPAVGEKRLENEFSVMDTFTLPANQDTALGVTFLGSQGDSIVPVAQQYIAQRGLPDLPEPEGGLQHSIRLLAAGWLDSDGHQNGLWRHAVWPGFGLSPAADAPSFMTWLAHYTEDDALATRLLEAAEHGLERLSPYDNYLASVGHCPRPTPVLLYGSLSNNIERMMEGARNRLNAFDAMGIRRYHQADPEKPNYGRTHFEDHANGYNAQALEPIMQAAVFSGSDALKEEALRLLDLQTEHYANTVPRGAQTWEMPLHTPDILGSARLIRTYVLGYLLTGDESYLDEAQYWAWTGIPLIYLDHPVEGPVGTYATTAVLGATNWVAPNWIGQPVQWCGLVYRSALQDLIQTGAENADFWSKVANGITLSGIEQTFPLSDEERQGLLPDYYLLKQQVSDGPAISPGTVQAHMAEAFGLTPYYSVERLNDNNVLVHAPGDINLNSASNTEASMEIEVWTEAPYWLRITNVPDDATVQWNDQEPLKVEYDSEYGGMNVQVQGNGVLSLSDM